MRTFLYRIWVRAAAVGGIGSTRSPRRPYQYCRSNESFGRANCAQSGVWGRSTYHIRRRWVFVYCRKPQGMSDDIDGVRLILATTAPAKLTCAQCTASSTCVVLLTEPPAVERRLIMYSAVSVCLSVCNQLYKRDISKTSLTVLCKNSEQTLPPWKLLVFAADHIQDSWLSAIVVSIIAIPSSHRK